MDVNNSSNSLVRKYKETDWVIIFQLEGFRKFISFEELMKLSHLSRGIRKDLKARVFRNTSITKDKLKINTSFCELYSKTGCLYKEYNFSEGMGRDGEGNHWKPYRNFDTDLDAAFDSLEHEFASIGPYSKTLDFYLYKMGFFIFPLVHSFANLTSLSLTNSSAPLISFVEMKDTLKSLKILSLLDVTVIKTSTQTLEWESITLPSSLRKLVVEKCTFYEPNLVKRPSKFICNSTRKDSLPPFQFPPQYLPALKVLGFLPPRSTRKELGNFLALNLQLESLTCCASSLDEYTLSIIGKCAYLTELDVNWSSSEVCHLEGCNSPTLKYIQSLKISNARPKSYQLIQNLISSCTELKRLSYDTSRLYEDSFDESDDFAHIGIFFQTLPSILPNLKYLNLGDYVFEDEWLDLNNFKSLTCFEFRTRDLFLVSMELPVDNTNLKKIKLIYNGRAINSDDVKMIFAPFEKHWKTEAIKRTVVFTKL